MKIEDEYLDFISSKPSWWETRQLLLYLNCFIRKLANEVRGELDIGEGLGMKEGLSYLANKIEIPNMRIPKNISDARALARLLDEMRKRDYQIPEIESQLRKFNHLFIDYKFMENMIVFKWTLFPAFSKAPSPQLVTSPNNPIREAGVYLKWHPNLLRGEILDMYSQAQEIALNSPFSATLFPKGAVTNATRKKYAPLTLRQFELYRAVEHRHLKKVENSCDSGLLTNTYEEVAPEFNVSKGTLQRMHSTIRSRYLLPSHTELPKIMKTTYGKYT